MFTIQQRDVPEQLVLTEQRHVKAAELPDWIRAAGGRLTTAAAGHGGITGPAFIVYHGPVSADSESLVEVCVPIRSEQGNGVERRDAPRARPSRGLRQNHKSAGPVPGDPAGLSGHRQGSRIEAH